MTHSNRHETAKLVGGSAFAAPQTVDGIEVAYRALVRVGDCDSDGHLLEWREAQLRAVRASRVADLIIKLECLAELTGCADGLTAKGTLEAHEWVQSLLRDAVYLAGVSEGAD